MHLRATGLCLADADCARTPAARAAAEQATTRLAKVTATCAVTGSPADTAAAMAGQSMHQIASTPPSHLSPVIEWCTRCVPQRYGQTLDPR